MLIDLDKMMQRNLLLTMMDKPMDKPMMAFTPLLLAVKSQELEAHLELCFSKLTSIKETRRNVVVWHNGLKADLVANQTWVSFQSYSSVPLIDHDELFRSPTL